MPESKSVVLLSANKSLLVFGQLHAFNVKQLQEEVIVCIRGSVGQLRNDVKTLSSKKLG